MTSTGRCDEFNSAPGSYAKFAALSRPLEFHQRPATGALGAELLIDNNDDNNGNTGDNNGNNE